MATVIENAINRELKKIVKQMKELDKQYKALEEAKKALGIDAKPVKEVLAKKEESLVKARAKRWPKKKKKNKNIGTYERTPEMRKAASERMKAHLAQKKAQKNGET